MKYEVLLESPISNNFRCKLACDSLDIDIAKKNKHHLIINATIPDSFNIGVIYGASGSGKTTLAKNIFGQDVFKSPLQEDIPIINQFNECYSYEECASMLSGIGLNSVPCWVRPVYTLSNGQKARAEAALLMSQDKEIIIIDEWTSVVDRNVAKAMSHTIQKYAKRKNKKIILLSCHYDVIEWLNPDWLIDCNKQEFIKRENPDFFFTEREKIEFTIKPISSESWKYFSKYHYLSEKLPGGKNYFFGLFINDNQIGFQCFSNYVPQVKGKKIIYHSNRTVIHPDYQGFGLGIKLINITSKYMKDNYDYKIMAKFSAMPVFKSMIKQKE
jgi:ABC-type Mn2+/Zn2+ transport system ATPase subunit